MNLTEIPNFKNWGQAIHKTILDAMYRFKKGVKYDFQKFQDLVYFCRNLCEHVEHITKDNPNLVPIIGKTLESVMKFLTKCFPWLNIVTQNIVD